MGPTFRKSNLHDEKRICPNTFLPTFCPISTISKKRSIRSPFLAQEKLTLSLPKTIATENFFLAIFLSHAVGVAICKIFFFNSGGLGGRLPPPRWGRVVTTRVCILLFPPRSAEAFSRPKIDPEKWVPSRGSKKLYGPYTPRVSHRFMLTLDSHS